MTEEEIVARGKAVFEQCYQGVLTAPQSVAPASFGELNFKMFHETWGDQRISMRDKRLVVLGVFAGRGGDPSLLAIHLRAALRNQEITGSELEALVRFIMFYAGAPAASALHLALAPLLQEAEADEAP